MAEPRPRPTEVRRARIMVSVLLLASLFVILTHQLTGAKPAERPGASTTAPGGALLSTTTQHPAGTTSPLTESVERDLLLTPASPLGEPGAAEPEMKRWPATGSVETVRDVNLAAYYGRTRAEQPLRGITVVLDPGHGGIDSGCGWPVGNRVQDVMEKDVVLSVARHAEMALRALGAQVILLREDDSFLSIFSRPARVGQLLLTDFIQQVRAARLGSAPIDRLLPLLDPIIAANEDLFGGVMGGSGTSADLKYVMDLQRQYPDWLLVSIHCNATEYYPEARGLQVYYTSGEVVRHDERIECHSLPCDQWQPSYQFYDDAGRLRLASLLYDAIAAAVPALGDGTSAPLVDQDFAILREQNLASAMLELGFLTNDGDRAVLADTGSQQRIGEAIADAVYSYYCAR